MGIKRINTHKPDLINCAILRQLGLHPSGDGSGEVWRQVAQVLRDIEFRGTSDNNRGRDRNEGQERQERGDVHDVWS